jgi:hypothetical protein
MDIFKEKLNKVDDISLTKAKPTPLASKNKFINEVIEDIEGEEDNKHTNAIQN